MGAAVPSQELIGLFGSAAWLTPLLDDPEAAEPLVSHPAPQSVLIGSSDPFLDRTWLTGLPGVRRRAGVPER